MATQPVLPPDEAPLDEETVDLFLSNMGTDMVLVEGQALAFWMSRFGIEQNGVAISNAGHYRQVTDRRGLILHRHGESCLAMLIVLAFSRLFW